MLSDDQRREVEGRVGQFVADVERQALTSPESKRKIVRHGALASARTDAQPCKVAIPAGTTVRSQLNSALAALLAEDDRVLLLGEDLHDPYGGAFKVTENLSSTYPDRVISTPISEAGITGATIGLALAGLRPIQEIMFADFLSLCVDQIYNHAVKFPGMFDGITVPMIIRTPCGGRRGYGPTHSQSPENIFVSVPGLTVVYPSHRHNVAEMMRNSVRCWQQPLLFLEHKLLYGVENDAADYETVTPAGADDIGADIFPMLARRHPDSADACIVTWGGMLLEVEKAVQRLEEDEELCVDVIVLALLNPLPRATLMSRLLQYDVLLVAEESHHEYGVSAELLAMLAESGHKSTVVRVGTPPVPIASARTLEREIIPDSEKIITALLRALGA
jgi:2-oxoisovalerate dehydrogenase E1 component